MAKNGFGRAGKADKALLRWQQKNDARMEKMREKQQMKQKGEEKTMESNKVSIDITLDQHGNFNVSASGKREDFITAFALAALNITSVMGTENIAKTRKWLCDFILAAPAKQVYTDKDIADIAKWFDKNRNNV